jgi:Type I phosphodiesterase / nucleotide pyrophosphatase
MPPPLGSTQRRFLIVQIDGLSDRVLRLALGQGQMPTLARLLREGALSLAPIPVGLPTSTPAFQARLMYGEPAVDIPAFEFLDKRRREYRWFPQPWTAAAVEAAHADGHAGIMSGGRTYGCVFSGGAADSVLTFSRLLRPSFGWGTFGVRAMLVPSMLLAWVTSKLVVASAAEGVRGFLYALGRTPMPPAGQPLSRRVALRWLRELFTLSVTADLYAGARALYVNFVGYDVLAHALGPEHPEAFRELRRLDRSIRELWRVVRRVPELRYDVFVLSDHGQVESVPFELACGGERPVDAILTAFGRPPSAVTARRRNAVWSGDLCVLMAGPNINLYLMDVPGHAPESTIEARHPGALGRLSGHPGIGFVLVRGREGFTCYYRGQPYRTPLPSGPTGCPVFDRPDRALLVRELEGLLAMPSGGDIMIFGNESPHGCVSYLGERGSHAGPSPEEFYGFVLAPPSVPFDWSRVTGPSDLYPLFASYARAPDPSASGREPPQLLPSGAARREEPSEARLSR